MRRRRDRTLHIGVARFTFELPAETLKEKRAIVRSLVDRLRTRFNASVVEAGPLDHPGSTEVVAVCVSNDVAYLQGQMQAMLRAIESSGADAVLVGVSTDVIEFP